MNAMVLYSPIPIRAVFSSRLMSLDQTGRVPTPFSDYKTALQ